MWKGPEDSEAVLGLSGEELCDRFAMSAVVHSGGMCVHMCPCVCTGVCVCSYVSGQNYRDVHHISIFPDLVQTPLLHPPLDTKEVQR